MKNGAGLLYLFNQSFDLAESGITLDESSGFKSSDHNISAHMVYPVRAPIAGGKLSYGDHLQVPIIGKDCVVIEIGLEEPSEAHGFGYYENLANSVNRSFNTIFSVPYDELISACNSGELLVEVGNKKTDYILGKNILEGIGAFAGRTLNIEECLLTDPASAAVRLIIGTHEGLCGHPEIGGRFREIMYNRYIDWEGGLVSGPLVAKLESGAIPTYCLIAPRSEQLQQLATDLHAKLTKNAVVLRRMQGGRIASKIQSPLDLTSERVALRFQPMIVAAKDKHVPYDMEDYGDISMVRYEITVTNGEEKKRVWTEERAPFLTYRAGQLQERLLSLNGLSRGGASTIDLKAEFVDGNQYEDIAIGFRNVEFVELD